MDAAIRPAPDGAVGFDAATPLDAATCTALFEAGMKFAVRYISLRGAESRDLSVGEVNNILDAGLALMVVQHVRNPGWTPSAAMGMEDGLHGVEMTSALALPNGLCIWCDLEGINGMATAKDTIAYANAWTKAVHDGGYDPGVYVGYGVPLSSQQLYKSLSVRRYWRSASSVPDVMTRGYQMIQKRQRQIAGLEVNPDVIQTDHLGDRPTWLEPLGVT